ncbi:hypothetical protein [Bacillus alkalicellulosilyticus]|uniref:hypothetical protein n=1 Tax=Alkalihalobacterium alkalicellulosilyticum TaxID=1912214 RepID=UPI000996253C|nr:hypothetical protein [Bacillus alkalicellulosilyticus]
MKRYIILVVGLLLILLIASFVIKVTPTAPNQTRMVIDHTYQIYIAPPCFNDAEVTNYLEETTLERALQLDYEPESACTVDALTDEPRALFFYFHPTKWDRSGEWK